MEIYTEKEYKEKKERVKKESKREDFKGKEISKRGQIGWILTIIGGLILIGGIVLILILINNKVPVENNLNSPMTIYINNLDNQTKYQLTGKFYVVENQTLVASGDLSDNSLVEVKNINSSSVKVFCKSDGYYLSETDTTFTQVETQNNASKITCYSNSYGDLKIESSSNVQNPTGEISLVLSSPREFKNISGAISWNSGFIWVKYNNQESAEIPNSYKNNYDYAFFTNTTLDNSNTTLTFQYKASDSRLNSDCLTITLFDRDFVLINGVPTDLNEYGGNLGNPKDFSKTFCYEI